MASGTLSANCYLCCSQYVHFAGIAVIITSTLSQCETGLQEVGFTGPAAAAF